VNVEDRTLSRANRAVAVSIPYQPDFEDLSVMRERLVAARDTLIVFSLQVVFRVTTFLRHLNN
jgi:hypothetical protein